MGEANRMREQGVQFKQLKPGEQIQVDLKNATPKECENGIAVHTETGVHTRICGCDLFIPVVRVYTVSAFVSPTGQEMMAQQPVLVCMECKEVLK